MLPPSLPFLPFLCVFSPLPPSLLPFPRRRAETRPRSEVTRGRQPRRRLGVRMPHQWGGILRRHQLSTIAAFAACWQERRCAKRSTVATKRLQALCESAHRDFSEASSPNTAPRELLCGTEKVSLRKRTNSPRTSTVQIVQLLYASSLRKLSVQDFGLMLPTMKHCKLTSFKPELPDCASHGACCTKNLRFSGRNCGN